MTRIAVPALTVLVVVATLVGLAGWNRSDQPRLLVTLTERELPRMWPTQSADEDRGRQLRIATDVREEPLDARNWLPESRLRAIGFHFNVPVGAPEAADTYTKAPSRLAWVAFEHDGQAWRDIERRRALQRQAESFRRIGLQSRLVPIDAGPDFDELRDKYPTGHLIVRAIIGLVFVPPERGGPIVYGAVREIVPSRIAVPSHVRPVLDTLSPLQQQADAPRYEVDVAIGRLGVPYVRSVRPLAKP